MLKLISDALPVRFEWIYWVIFRDKDLRNHLKNVYGTLALCVLVAAVGAYVHVATDLLQVNWSALFVRIV